MHSYALEDISLSITRGPNFSETFQTRWESFFSCLDNE